MELEETTQRADFSRGEDHGREGIGKKLVKVWSAASVGDIAGETGTSWTVGDIDEGEGGLLNSGELWEGWTSGASRLKRRS